MKPKLENLYSAPANRRVIDLLPEGTRTILDIGCGTGRLAEELGGECIVDGITSSQREKELAGEFCRNVWLHDLENGLPEITLQYDVVVMSHILEHIANPKSLMLAIGASLTEESRVICAIPNMLFLYNRVKLFMGNIEYTEYGIMDYTHIRWYTRRTIVDMFVEYGSDLEASIDNGNVPLGPVRKILPKGAQDTIDKRMVDLFPGLLAWEFVSRFVRRKGVDGPAK